MVCVLGLSSVWDILTYKRCEVTVKYVITLELWGEVMATDKNLKVISKYKVLTAKGVDELT